MAERPDGAVDLPNGGWVSLKDPAELTNRNRKMLQRYALPLYGLREKMKLAGVTQDQLEADAVEAVAGNMTADDLEIASTAQAAYIVAYVQAWSLDMPLPTMETVDDIPVREFDAIAKATAQLGDGTVDISEPSPDPASPSVPSPA